MSMCPETKELLDLEASCADEYIKKLCSLKKQRRLTWQEIGRLTSLKYNITYSESWYRRHYKEFVPQDMNMSDSTADSSELLEQLTALKLDIQKERVKVSDERAQNRSYIRRLAREETLIQIARESATIIGQSKSLLSPVYQPAQLANKDREAILQLSDWHYGMVCDNFHNMYDPEIAKERVAILKDKVIEYGKKHNVSTLHVMNLSDLIAGRIHLTIRLESRFDTITQVIQVAEILAELLSDLSEHFNIEYYDCLDNHSRLEPVKTDSLDLESLTRVIPWYLSKRLEWHNVHLNSNKFGHDIIDCECLGHKVIGVHGHRDNHRTSIEKLTTFTQTHFDLICTAHMHHFSADEHNDTLVIANGSLMGTDSNAKNLRLSAKASQNLIIVSEENVAECIYRIVLN